MEIEILEEIPSGNNNNIYYLKLCNVTFTKKKLFNFRLIYAFKKYNFIAETLNLQINDYIKSVFREIIISVHRDANIQTEKEYKDEIVNRLKDFWPNTFKDKFQLGHMPDITIEDECIVDIRSRNRGIVMTQDRNTMKESMIDLKLPAIQVNFIDGTSAVILWFSKSYLFFFRIL